MQYQKLLQNMCIKKLLPEHLEQYNDLLRYAFQVTEEDLLKVGWEDDDIRQAKYPILETASVLGWFDGDKLASQISVYPMQMNIQGAICHIGFGTGVATYPEYAGLGLMSRLMKQSLRKMREHGQSIALLHPYSIPFYRHKGWEIISDKMTFHIKDFQLPKKTAVDGRVRRIAEDCPDLWKLHNCFAQKTHGCIVRDELAWEEYWRWDVDDTTVAMYYGADEEPLGYMVYLLKNDVLHIKELVHLNYEAWKGLWGYVTAHDSMITEVKGNSYYNDSIAFWLEDSDIKETIQPYLMGRIVDCEQFITQYHFADDRRSDTVTFQVEDSLLEWNNCTFTIQFSENEPPKLVNESAEKKVSLPIGTLTAMLMGYKRPSYLQKIEQLQADSKTITLLEQVISKEKAYISDYI